MKILLFATVCFAAAFSSCTKDKSYINPSDQERFSINFLFPPSIGSPYNAGDPLLINIIMTGNKVSVSSVDFAFSEGANTLATVHTDAITASPIRNDHLWSMQYFTGTMYIIPTAWIGKTITLSASANGASVAGNFNVN